MADVAERSDSTRAVSLILGRRVRVKVKDGRMIVGEFACLDPQGNLVLTAAQEEVAPLRGARTKYTPMGSIIVPEAQRVSVELTRTPDEALAAKLAAAARSAA